MPRTDRPADEQPTTLEHTSRTSALAALYAEQAGVTLIQAEAFVSTLLGATVRGRTRQQIANEWSTWCNDLPKQSR